MNLAQVSVGVRKFDVTSYISGAGVSGISGEGEYGFKSTLSSLAWGRRDSPPEFQLLKAASSSLDSESMTLEGLLPSPEPHEPEWDNY